MYRSQHNSYGFWLKEFKHTKTNQYVSKHSLDNTTFIVYSIKVKKTENGLTVKLPKDLPPADQGIFDLFFGQYFSPQRNLSLFTKFYFDYDLSINVDKAYDTDERYDNGKAQIFLKNDSIKEFGERLDVSNSFNSVKIPFVTDFYELYLGYNRVRNYKPQFDTLFGYESVSSDVIASMGEDCFNWIKIVDHQLEELTEEDMESSTLVLDYKAVLDTNKIINWIESNFSDKIDDLTTLLGSNELEFNFIFYPPSSTGLQFVDVPEILFPIGILKSKIVDKVVFEVKKSIVNNAQKMFEVYFLDKKTGSVIYQDTSLISPDKFTIESGKLKTELKPFKAENSVFENIGELNFPSNTFTVTYKILNELVKYLADHPNYTILIKITDLTSERRI